MQYEMLYDKLLVRRVAQNRRTEGGLYMPDARSTENDPILVEVLAAGPGKPVVDMEGRDYTEGRMVPLNVKVGDFALLARWGGHTNLPGYSDRDHIIIREGDLLAVIRGVVEEEAAA